jgi:drug/metabolite transporter (DMT)-like permease
VLILGFSPILARLADAPGTIIAFYRMFFGTLFLSIPFFRGSRKHLAFPKQAIGLAIFGGALFGADLAAWATGIVLSDATLPTLFANTNPIWVGIGAWLIFKERLNPKFWLGLLIAISGAAIILGLGKTGGVGNNEGALFGALAGVFYGGYFLVAQKGRDVLDATSFFWFSSLSSAVFLFFLNLILGHSLVGYSTETWLNFLLQGLLIQAAGWWFVSYAQGFLTASLVSPTMLGQPVLTAILAGPLLGEKLRSRDFFGGITVLIGIFLVHRGKSEEQAKEQG